MVCLGWDRNQVLGVHCDRCTTIFVFINLLVDEKERERKR